MKRVRWKANYSRGVLETDKHNKNLVNILNDLVLKASQLEHCQDLSDLHKRISELAGVMLQDKQIDDVQFNAIQTLLTTDLPLAARGTPACHNCDLCDYLDEQVGQWFK